MGIAKLRARMVTLLPHLTIGQANSAGYLLVAYTTASGTKEDFWVQLPSNPTAEHLTAAEARILAAVDALGWTR